MGNRPAVTTPLRPQLEWVGNGWRETGTYSRVEKGADLLLFKFRPAQGNTGGPPLRTHRVQLLSLCQVLLYEGYG